MLNETIGDARDLARGLGPVGLAMAGLDGALESFALNVQKLFRVTCTFECDRPFARLSANLEAHLFRVAQEAANNAVSHSGGDRVEICLKSADGIGTLSVLDNGRGLANPGHSGGIGMHTMTYRARLIGASLEIRNRPQAGVAVVCRFPLIDAVPEAR